MQFCGKTIPGSLFKLARDRMLTAETFTPADIRKHLLANGADALLETNALTNNHPIIANRVFLATRQELADSGQVAPVKRGVWSKVGD